MFRHVTKAIFLFNSLSIDAKRLIGRRFEDIPDNDIKKWPFKVANEGGNPKYEVSYKNEGKMLSPQEISAAVLSKMKQSAENYLNEPVQDAVITVPAYFNDAQRQATKDAADIAGLNVLQLINEPTAAAIAYGLEEKLTSDQNVLVFDMGGGTFDVSILTIDNNVFEVKAVGGDTHLGGEDFNNKMLDYFLKEIEQKFGKELSSDKHAISRILVECEKAKIALSTSTVATLTFTSLFGDTDYSSTMTRACFEDINDDFFSKAFKILENTLSDARLEKADIHEIILVGGSTYIPKVQKLLKDFFGGKELNRKIKPDEAVAYGAAVFASILHGDDEDDNNLVLLDVTPLSLGIATIGEIMSKIVERNTTIPIKMDKPFTTTYDYQTAVRIDIYEGEDDDVKQNDLLGSFKLTGIPQALAGVPSIKVSIEIDADGILKVYAVEKSSGVENMITITEYKNRLSSDEILSSRKQEQTFLRNA